MPFEFKRGQTFSFTGQLKNGDEVQPITDWTVACQLRSINGLSLVQTIAATIVDGPTGIIKLFVSPTDTAKWPCMPHLLDLKLTDENGQIMISQTEELLIVERMTR